VRRQTQPSLLPASQLAGLAFAGVGWTCLPAGRLELGKVETLAALGYAILVN